MTVKVWTLFIKVLYTIISPIHSSTKVDCETSVSDFKEILKYNTFIDKTLLIKDLFDGPSVKLITAPRRFGKSTNLNMVKRFLEIDEVNNSWNGGCNTSKEDIKTTSTNSNYKLFKENNLTIFCKYEQFFNEHFGRYPVIFINYNSLSGATSFDDLLANLRTILKWTFLKHEYLLRVKNLWSAGSSLNVNTFKKYIDSELNKNLTKTEIQDGFKLLSYILYRHFGRQVFVLIDEYDSYLDNLLFKNSTDVDKIFSFVQLVNGELLKSNEYVRGALLTGVLRLAGEGLSPAGSNIAEYTFLDDHPFSKYYGLTENELDEVVMKLIKNVTERKQIKLIIDDYYGGYNIIDQNIKMYNIWSVFTFLQRGKKVKSYWCRPENFDSFRLMFTKEDVLRVVERLMLGKTIRTDVSRSLSKANIFDISCAIKNLTLRWKNLISDFTVLLYHLGYLSVIRSDGDSVVGGARDVYVKIPNEETKYELAKLLLKSYKLMYDFNTDFIENIQSLIDSFRPGNDGYKIFTCLCKSLTVLFNTSSFPVETANDIQAVVYSYLITRAVYSRTVLLKSADDPSGRVDILTLNKHNVAAYIKTKIRHTVSDDLREWCAIDAHKQMIDKKYYGRIDKGFEGVCGKVLIGICFDLQKRASVSYSYRYNTGDELGLTSVEVTS